MPTFQDHPLLRGPRTQADSLHLSPEVLLIIFKNIQYYPRTLYSASLVCRSWYEPASDILYRHLSVDTVAQAQALTQSGLHRYKTESLILAGNAEDILRWRPVLGTLLDLCVGLKELHLCPFLERVPIRALETESLQSLEILELLCSFDMPWVERETELRKAPSPSLRFSKLRHLVTSLSSSQEVPVARLVSACLRTNPPVLTSIDLAPNDHILHPYVVGSIFPLAPFLQSLRLPFSDQLSLEVEWDREPPLSLLDLLENAPSLRHLTLSSLFIHWTPQSIEQLFDEIFQPSMRFQLFTLDIPFHKKLLTVNDVNRLKHVATGANAILGQLKTLKFSGMSRADLEALESWNGLADVFKGNGTDVVTSR